MSDWSKPTLSSNYTDVIAEVKGRDDDLAKQFDGTTSPNIPTNTIRWNAANRRHEKWNGTAWGELVAKATTAYAIRVEVANDADLLGGQLPAYYTNIPGRLGYTPLNTSAYTASDVLAKLLTVDGVNSGLDADLLDGQNASAFSASTHNHSTTYLGITAKAADSEKLDGFDGAAFLRSINGTGPDGNGNVAVDLASRVAKSGDTMSGNLTMTSGANIVSSRPGDNARNTGFKMSDGQDLGEMNRSNEYFDDLAANCNGYLPTANCTGNPNWTPPNGNWWTWGVTGVPTTNCANWGNYDGTNGTTEAFTAVTVSPNYDAYYIAADEIGGAENRRNYRNCNCGAFNCRTNCNCACDCTCACDCV